MVRRKASQADSPDLVADAGSYVPVHAIDGWVASKVFAKKFQLQKEIDPLGHLQFSAAAD